MAESAALLVDEILPEKPMRQWVLSVPYPLRLLFAREPAILSKVLGIVYRAISSFLIKQTGETHKSASTGAVTLIQRFGSALNLNIHFHMLFLDGVYIKTKSVSKRKLIFKELNSMKPLEIQNLTEVVSLRIMRYLERHGIIERDTENTYLTEDMLDVDSLLQLHGHSITYRIAVGPNIGRKVMTLKTLLEQKQSENPNKLLGKVDGFSLHAGVAAQKHQVKKLERLCRYITRPAVSTQRLSLTDDNRIKYELKTPYRDGTTHIILASALWVSH